jgi:hypothetical protein
MKLEFSRYNKKLQWATLTFDLLRWALLHEFRDAGLRRFMQSQSKQKAARFKMTMKLLLADPYIVFDEKDRQDLERRHKRKLSAEVPVTPSPKWAEYKGQAQLALNASELVLLVAIFEAFLKEIHYHALLAQPKLLARGKPNRSVSLKDLFRAGLEQFRCKEAQRQVREVDRLSTRERAKFFQRCLSLRWGDDPDVKRIDQLIHIRHNLVHSTPDRSVADTDVQDARKLFRSVASTVFNKACGLYPTTFSRN